MPPYTPRRLTVLSSMCRDGQTAFMTYPGGTTGDIFAAYLKTVLIPTLKVGGIVAMDNMRSYHVKTVEQTLYAAGMVPPSCRLDLNPIETLWSKLKSVLRLCGIRLAADLPDAFQRAFALVRPVDCRHWSATDGCCSQF